ncbi:hypothetical protein FIV49_02780 [Cylindrospermopsis raciborskii GIHE 2018]|nr:hypothetical protein FIV49_02780 [Cylindrospermopsis raciborskii GIHE 2018]
MNFLPKITTNYI